MIRPDYNKFEYWSLPGEKVSLPSLPPCAINALIILAPPSEVTIQSTPIGVSLSLSADGPHFTMVTGFDVVGDYVIGARIPDISAAELERWAQRGEPAPNPLPTHGTSYTVHIVGSSSDLPGSTGGGGGFVASPPKANLVHALTLGAKVAILFAQNKDTRNYEVLATPPPTVLPGLDKTAAMAAKDSAVIDAIRSLVGMNQDALALSMATVLPIWKAAVTAAQTPAETIADSTGGWQLL